MDARLTALPLSLFFALTLNACGGGGSDTPAPDAPDTTQPEPEEPTPETSTARHFVYANKDSGELFMVTDDNLNAPVSLATGITSYQLITSWDYDLDNQTLSNFDNKVALYAKGGEIYKVSLTDTPETTRVSSESAYCPVVDDSLEFGSISVGGFDDAGSSWSGYTSAGVDGQCGTADDQRRLVKLSMTADDAPVTPPGLELTDIFNADTGLLDGWLLANAEGKLIRSDADFLATTVVTGSPISAQWQFIDSSGNKDLLLASDSNTLYVYDEDSGELTTLVNGFRSSGSLVDDSAVYWVDPTDTLVKKAALDGSSAATLANQGLSLEALTDDYVIFRSADNGHYYSVPKSGGAAAVDVFAPTSEGTLIAGPNNLLYINNIEIAQENSRISAHIAQAADGRIMLNLGHAHWAGITPPNTLSLAANNPFHPANILLVQHGSTDTGWTQYNGGSIHSYEAATMNPLGEIGSIPDDKRIDAIFGLASYTLTTDSNTPTDVFYLDSNVVGSLTRLTNAQSGSGFTSN